MECIQAAIIFVFSNSVNNVIRTLYKLYEHYLQKFNSSF